MMKNQCHTWIRHLTESVIIFIFGGLFCGFITCPVCFSQWNIFIQIWIFCGTMWILLWKGNEYISNRIDRRISWLRQPGKRFLIGIISMILYTASASSLNTYVFVTYIKSGNFGMTFRGSIPEVMAYSFGITVFIMLLFLSISFLKSWKQAAINEEKLRRESIASQYEALKSQVNPHFLFNTLNALSSLIYEDREKAVQFLNKFSDVYRYVLDSRNREVVPVKEEIDFVRSYLYLLQSRYDKNLEVVLDENIREGFVPPMVIQLLVENAVKHNIIADGSRVRISIRQEGSYIKVENNLKPKSNTPEPAGMGIENIKSRYSLLSDLTVMVKNDGEVFSVSVPVLEVSGS